ncbi:MAG: hypothetical protein K2P09_08560 [Erysipelotrichales bacterium]|nr:hypothetical protein [Erysipelotrichales bacterium]
MDSYARKIIKQYHDNQDVYRSIKDDILDIFERIVETNHFRISNMAIRIKNEEALKKKIIYKNKYQDIHEITDVVAARIITLFENDVDRLFQCIQDNFQVLEYKDKRKKNYDDRIDFGYNSLHLLLKFSDERCQFIEYADYKNIVFELQIRTTIQHSWAEIEHGLGYKSQYEIPKNIRRRLTRLSATLELLDEEFVYIAKEIENYNKGLVHIEKILKTDINANSLMQYVNTSPIINGILETLHNEFHFEFERDGELISQSRLIQRFHYMGYTYIHELDDFVRDHVKEIEELSRQRIIDHNEKERVNIYNVLVWISLVMLVREGLRDPEDIFSEEIIEGLSRFKQ